jgi:hypothetical protein
MQCYGGGAHIRRRPSLDVAAHLLQQEATWFARFAQCSFVSVTCLEPGTAALDLGEELSAGKFTVYFFGLQSAYDAVARVVSFCHYLALVQADEFG